eukprot:TRINITY_DN7619_c0_g1_i2.p1 TRINITY_DN7619_c0_g1~~TRINITY_DN7619_c0_g1_i2.p1  ORF type:complete len:511 (-),score=80.43 TRINITY_DN7619_c0_g1_i2:54-1529(-)
MAEPFLGSSPCPLGSLRDEMGKRFDRALCHHTPRGNLRGGLTPREDWIGLRHTGYRQAQIPRPLSNAGASHVNSILQNNAAAGGGSKVPALSSAANELGWPPTLVGSTGLKPRDLIPRGSLFEAHSGSCPVEPQRTGTYQFCVVGIDVSVPGKPSYMAWEPTGHFDRWFSSHEIEKLLAFDRFGRNIGQNLAKDCVSIDKAQQKDGLSVSRVVRWPEPPALQGRLPDLDELGRPILPPKCRFTPRNSMDVLAPMMHEWKRRFLPGLLESSRQRSAGEKQRLRLLVLDDSGRLARAIQETFPTEFEVVAADDPPKGGPRPLRNLRDRYFPVDIEMLSCAHCEEPAIRQENNSFDVVIMPFLLGRRCENDERRLLKLWREGLRCCRGHVLVAEDFSNLEAQLDRWKSVLQAEWSAPVLLEETLWAGKVSDHFLSRSVGSDITADACARRYLILDASSFVDHREERCSNILPFFRDGGKIGNALPALAVDPNSL